MGAAAVAAACSAGPDPAALAIETPLTLIEVFAAMMICDAYSVLWVSPWQRDPQIESGCHSSFSSCRVQHHSLAGSQSEEGSQSQSWVCSCLESTRFEQASADKQMAATFCSFVDSLLAAGA